jgi:choline-glycine betaine transporter
MHVVALAWLFVVSLWALTESLAPGGGVLGALATLLFYGALPLAVVLYLMATPARRRARRRAAEYEAAIASALEPEMPSVLRQPPGSPQWTARCAGSVAQPDGRSHAPGDAVATKREEA